MNEYWQNFHKHIFRRGQIIEAMATIEDAINIFISIHYFGTLNKEFRSTVLEDEYFSIQLRKNILQNILKSDYPEVDFPFDAFSKIQRLRNIFAHAPPRIQREKNADGKFEVKSDVLYTYRGVNHEAADLEKEFDELEPIVIKAISSLPKMDKLIFMKPVSDLEIKFSSKSDPEGNNSAYKMKD